MSKSYLLSLLSLAGVEVSSVAPSGKRPLRPLQPPIRGEDSDHMTFMQPHSEEYINKLNQLEKLQYQLTRQVCFHLCTHLLPMTSVFDHYLRFILYYDFVTF